MPSSQNFWETLFSGPAGAGDAARVPMRVVSKRGQPFLLLPRHGRAAAAALELYPAQTPRARLARNALRWLLKLGIPAGTKQMEVVVSTTDAFARFLRSLAGERESGLPMLGILAGNPASTGQRFLLLLFDSMQKPVAVVKAGVSERAKALIAHEQAFLRAVPQGTRSIPPLRSTFEAPELRALALDFFEGHTPTPGDDANLAGLLGSWINAARTLPLSATAGWARLEAAASADATFAPLARELRAHPVHPAIEHGDFAPWNIKVSPAGNWTVLDWERGELAGMPAWDWFHYVMQRAILVERLPTSALADRAETLLRSEPFKDYAVQAGITGCERALFLAYLLHVVEVIKPSEGLTASGNLLAALAERWRRG